jgi:hypothetical protein
MRARYVYAALATAAWIGLGWAVEARAQPSEPPTFAVTASDGRLSPERIGVPGGAR